VLSDSIIGALIEAAGTSETSVNFYLTTRRNNPQDKHLPVSKFPLHSIRHFNIILTSIPCLPSSLFPRSPPKVLRIGYSWHIPVRLTGIDLITLTMLGKEYKLRNWYCSCKFTSRPNRLHGFKRSQFTFSPDRRIHEYSDLF
jgi:hypothetical protein